MVEAARGDGVEFPVPFARFASTLRGTPEEVFTKLIKIQHGREKHTISEWHELIEALRHVPAHPGV